MNNRRPCVLIVEDDKFLCSIYERRFSMDGFDVYIERSGDAVFDAIARVRPDCILLDIMLPIVDGLTVLTQLKQNAQTSDIPVIVMTNLGQKEDRARAEKIGANGYFIKAHFKPSEVVKKVQELLKQETHT